MGQPLASHTTDDPLVGQILSQRYRILAKVGEGAMARVYVAEHTGVGTNIVLKVLQPELADKPEVMERFLQEAKIASEIHHDNVIDIFYTGRSPEGHVFLAMEYLPGPTLFDLLEPAGAMAWSRAQPILMQIADALSAAHAHGVVHRDIKPENVLVLERWGPSGIADFVKVVDFGIANVPGADRAQGVVGTPEYMPPEQARALPPDPRDDVYAFGCLMFQVLTGDVPFTAPTVQQLLLNHVRLKAPAPSAQCPEMGIPAAADEIVRRALEKTRERRFQSMTEVMQALAAAAPPPPAVTDPDGGEMESVAVTSEIAPDVRQAMTAHLQGGAPAAEPPRRRSRSRSRLRVVLATALVAAFSAVAVLRHGPRPSPGHIEITTIPVDAEIFLDGQKLADRSPVYIDASPGPYLVTVKRDGYAPQTSAFELAPAATARVPITLVSLVGYHRRSDGMQGADAPSARQGAGTPGDSRAPAAAPERSHHHHHHRGPAAGGRPTGITYLDIGSGSARSR